MNGATLLVKGAIRILWDLKTESRGVRFFKNLEKDKLTLQLFNSK